MRLSRTREVGGWGLADENGGRVRHIAGGFSAWAPRLAGGEGMAALPLTGRSEPLAEGGDLRDLLGRVFHTDDVDPHGALAAVLGTRLAGRSKPVRSICGYAQVRVRDDRLSLGPTLVTRDEFGDEPPYVLCGCCSGRVDVAGVLQILDEAHELRTGDVVILGRFMGDPRLTVRLAGPPTAPEPGSALDLAARPLG